MTDLQATLDAIEQVAVHECGQCRRPLRPNDPSPDFCGPWCQEAWLRAKQEIVDLMGYEEPDDLPVHAFNLVEMYSPETTPVDPDDADDLHMGYSSELAFDLHIDLSRWYEAWARVQDRITQIWHVSTPGSSGGQIYEIRRRAMEERDRAPQGFSPQWVIYDEIRPFGVVINSLRPATPEPKLEPEPDPAEPPFGSDFDFEHTAAKSLPHEPPPAVMTAVPETNWQAVVDAAPRTGPERRTRAPRELRRTW